MSTETMQWRDAAHERERARKWFAKLAARPDARRTIDDLGDQLVLGDFDWREWLDSKPSQCFLNEVDRLRIDWESSL